MTATPDLHAERMRRIKRAQECRLYAAELKAWIAGRDRDSARNVVAQLLDTNDDPRFAHVPVVDVLLAVPRYGDDRVRRSLRVVGIDRHDARIRDLTPRQRCRLADTVRQPRLVIKTCDWPTLLAPTWDADTTGVAV